MVPMVFYIDLLAPRNIHAIPGLRAKVQRQHPRKAIFSLWRHGIDDFITIRGQMDNGDSVDGAHGF